MKSTISKSKTAITNGRWVLHSREFLWDNSCRVTSAAYQDNTKLLVIGFNNGVFGLYEAFKGLDKQIYKMYSNTFIDIDVIRFNMTLNIFNKISFIQLFKIAFRIT